MGGRTKMENGGNGWCKVKKTGIAQSKAAFLTLGFPKRASSILTDSITNSPNKKTRSPSEFKILNKFKVEKTL